MVTETIPLPVAKSAGTTLGLSLKDLTLLKVNKSKKDEYKVDQNLSTPENSTNQESLNEATLGKTWKEFFNVYLKQASPLVLHFADIQWQLQLPHTLRIPLTNEVEIKILEEFKADLVDYLRKENRNYLLQLETELIQEEEQDRIPYTNSERFKALITANPLLREMADTFGLDPEY